VRPFVFRKLKTGVYFDARFFEGALNDSQVAQEQRKAVPQLELILRGTGTSLKSKGVSCSTASERRAK